MFIVFHAIGATCKFMDTPGYSSLNGQCPVGNFFVVVAVLVVMVFLFVVLVAMVVMIVVLLAFNLPPVLFPLVCPQNSRHCHFAELVHYYYSEVSWMPWFKTALTCM
jgi:hypothetical protein